MTIEIFYITFAASIIGAIATFMILVYLTK